MAHDAGNRALAAELEERAARLKQRFNEQFWLPDKGYYAVALDKDKRPVDACTSNMRQCLWYGIVDEDKVPVVAERLMPRKCSAAGESGPWPATWFLQPGQLPQRFRLAPR